MRIEKSLAVMVAAGMVAAGGLVGPAGSASATEPVQRSSGQARADVDGDGRADSVLLQTASWGNTEDVLTLSVKTASGRAASTRFRVSHAEGEWVPPKRVLSGVLPADGVRGMEILVDIYGNEEGADAWGFRTYTWRKGKLVVLPAPGSGRSGLWGAAYPNNGCDGYTFSTVKGVRYVTRHYLRPNTGYTAYRGVHTTYAWRKSGWVKVKTQRVGSIDMNTANSRYFGFKGVKIS